MAAEKQKRQSSNPVKSAGTMASTMKDAAKLGVDAARLIGGDYSAIKDILRNKLFWEILLISALIISLVGMLLGSAIVGLITYVANTFYENLNESLLDQGIISSGSADYMLKKGWIYATCDTVFDTVVDIGKNIIDEAFSSVKNLAVKIGIGTKDNSQIKDQEIQDAGRNPTQEDIDTTIQSVVDAHAANKAIIDRLEMIKGRVKQRGMQLAQAVEAQYIGEGSQYEKIMQQIQKEATKKYEDENGTIVLFGGYDQKAAKQHLKNSLDLSAFELSDLQALKILALFSIQYDCQLNDIDMWSLMNYCGWYLESASGQLDDMVDTIYQTPAPLQYYGDLGNALSGMEISLATFEFDPLIVPTWVGSCAPQWMVEEISQLKVKYGKDVDVTQFQGLSNIPYTGIVDRIYYVDSNSMTVNRTEWANADLTSDVIRDRVMRYSHNVQDTWNAYVWARSSWNEGGWHEDQKGDIRRDDEGNHSYTYMLNNLSQNEVITNTYSDGSKEVISVTYWLNLYELTNIHEHIWGDDYYWNEDAEVLVQTIPVVSEHGPDHVFYDLNGSTYYALYLNERVDTMRYDAEGNLIDAETDYDREILETFKTFPDKRDAVVYMMYLAVDISFNARSIDEISFDLLGIWPSSLYNTTRHFGSTTYPNSGTYKSYNASNMLGKNESNGNYYYYLTGGCCIEIDRTYGAPPMYSDGTFVDTHRSTSEKSTGRLAFRTVTYEYGLDVGQNGMTSIYETPDSGWHQVSRDKAGILFEIPPKDGYRSAYLRVTVNERNILPSGDVEILTQRWLYKMDEFGPMGEGYLAGLWNPIIGGTEYAADHFGNRLLRKTWIDWSTGEFKSDGILYFERQSAYQYETYIDLVMALCEMLKEYGHEISYENWEPAMKRAEELSLNKTN